jgi:replication initiation and membrane attachment protein DnaB
MGLFDLIVICFTRKNTIEKLEQVSLLKTFFTRNEATQITG